MANITVSLPSDGDSIVAANYNTPVNTIVNEINGKLDNSNIASGAAIDGAKLANETVDTAQLKDGAVTAAKQGDSGWLSTTFSGYTGTLYYRKIGNRVQLGGDLVRDAGSFPATNTTVGTIPSGYRPSRALTLPIGAYASGTLRTAWVSIATNGNIVGFASGASAATDTISFGAISYLVD